MQCAQCQFDNPPAARFCAGCGVPLPQACPDCGAALPGGAKFCPGCGGRLQAGGPPAVAEETRTPPPTAASAESAERRQLTVMFCDLVGSTAISERMDPEDLREIIAAYRSTVTRAIERYEGYVARYLGDGLLVYFGYPRAHEDDAERAVRAGLAIVERVGRLSRETEIDLKVRVGVATGLVVVGDIVGEGVSEERAVLGDTPNLAARLQAAAAPDTVVIAAGTQRLVDGLFVCEELPPQTFKGISTPVRACRVLGASDAPSRFEATANRRLSPIVGREEEIGLLLKRWAQAREGEGQTVLLSGEAGVGKSRILRGFQEQAKRQAHSRVLYFCSPYHQNTALQPAIDQLERALRFEKDDDLNARLDKLEGVLTQLDLPVRQHAPVLAPLLALSSRERYPALALPPEETKTRTLESLWTVLEAMASTEPVLMIVEDVHWADSSTLEFLDLVIDRIASAAILLLITFRLEFEPRWTGHGHVTAMTLNRLSRRETVALVENVTDAKALPAEVMAQIVAKTDGVPLFVEELTKAVIESSLVRRDGERYVLTGPMGPLAVPASLQDSLTARLDRLAPVKEIAQLAATIGRTFTHELLAAVAPIAETELEEAMSQLVDAELVYRHGRPPATSYEFKHALVRDAAYASLLKSTRQEYHRNIAQTLEEHFAKTAEVEPALLAHHYAEAGLAERAITYWLKAGDLLHEQGSVAMSVSAYRKALELARDGGERCRALIGIAGCMRVTDNFDDALQALEEAEALAAAAQMTAELARIHYLRGNLYFPLGNIKGCLEEHDKALVHAREAGDAENEARALSGLGDAHYSKGRMRTSLEYFRRCIELSREHDFPHIQAANHYMVAWNRLYINEVRGALADALEAVDSAVEIGYLRAEMVARLTASRVLLELNELDAASEHIERGLSVADALGATRFKPFLMIFQGGVEFARGGHRSETVELMNRAMELCRSTSVKFLGPWVLSMLALVSDDPRVSREALREGEEILSGDCVGHNYFAFYRNAMEVSLRLQDWGEAERYAAALEAYSRPEPLSRCDFYVARGRQLARYGGGDRGAAVVEALEGLREQARRDELNAALPAIEKALADAAQRCA